jgi:hypothetical protein
MSPGERFDLFRRDEDVCGVKCIESYYLYVLAGSPVFERKSSKKNQIVTALVQSFYTQ